MIVNDEQRRALEFIATANRGGYRPTGREINQWRLNPDPLPARRGKLLEAAVPAVPERRVPKSQPLVGSHVLAGLDTLGSSKVLADFLRQETVMGKSLKTLATSGVFDQVNRLFAAEYRTIPGKPGKPAVYAEKPPEKFLAHLRRLGWVERDDRGGYGVTRLGHALLRAEADVDTEGEESAVMVLEASDELAYGRVLGVVAECGDAYVLDPYLGADELTFILKYTNACRFLVSKKVGPARLAELAFQIELTPLNAGGVRRQLRAGTFHDRWVIGDHTVYGLGSSLNGVGVSMTTLVPMPDTAARVIRDEAENLWSQGEVIAETRLDTEATDDASADTNADDEDEAVREEDGRFMHDSCPTRHRTAEAAARCTRSA